jgi:hypothetical protein
MTFKKMFLFLSMSTFAFVSMAAEVKFPLEKTISIFIDAQTLIDKAGALQISIPELKDDLQGKHQDGKFTTSPFDNPNFTRHLLLKEAGENNNILEGRVVIQTELIRTPLNDCRWPCHFCDGPVCTPNGRFKETIVEKITVDILGLIFFSKETFPVTLI